MESSHSASVGKQHEPEVPLKTSVPLLTPYFLPFSSSSSPSVWRHMHSKFYQLPGCFHFKSPGHPSKEICYHISGSGHDVVNVISSRLLGVEKVLPETF